MRNRQKVATKKRSATTSAKKTKNKAHPRTFSQIRNMLPRTTWITPKGKQKIWLPNTLPGENDKRLFTLDVFLISGPIARDFAKTNPVVSRRIQVRGSQTLAQLHQAIFRAFNRREDHFYEFQLAGKGPGDPKAARYVLSEVLATRDETESIFGNVDFTYLGGLNLEPDDIFGYWFDYGDDWWHQINVVHISANLPVGRYPKVTISIGKSPPQYPDESAEDES